MEFILDVNYILELLFVLPLELHFGIHCWLINIKKAVEWREHCAQNGSERRSFGYNSDLCSDWCASSTILGPFPVEKMDARTNRWLRQ